VPFNFAFEYEIRGNGDNQKGLELNGKLQLFAYINAVNIVGENIDTAKENIF
jgi:hypothetical protein